MKLLKKFSDLESAMRERHRAETLALFNAKRNAIRRVRIVCRWCTKQSPLKTYSIKLAHCWNPNTGSPNGGFDEEMPLQNAGLVCGKCNTSNYIYVHAQRDKILGCLTAMGPYRRDYATVVLSVLDSTGD